MKTKSITEAMKFHYGAAVGIPSPPLEERARERRPFLSKLACHQTGHLSQFLAALLTFAAFAADKEPPAEFPHEVRFVLGDTEFAPGDNITIQQVRGTSGLISAGQTYSVQGTYTLSSRDEAELSLFATTSNLAPTPIDPKQTVRIKKGSGWFHLIKTMNEGGYLHLSFYPVPSGSSFGGIYFGQGNWVLRNKDFRSLANSSRDSNRPAEGAVPDVVSLSGPNRALFEYLGNAVEPPASLDPAYTKEGLINAMRTAGQNAGVSLKKVEIDDLEFPFLVWIVCEEGDFTKLKDQIKKIDGYDFTGSVGSHTHYTDNIVPWRAFPPQSSQRIGRRLTLRQQVFCDRISARE